MALMALFSVGVNNGGAFGVVASQRYHADALFQGIGGQFRGIGFFEPDDRMQPSIESRKLQIPA